MIFFSQIHKITSNIIYSINYNNLSSLFFSVDHPDQSRFKRMKAFPMVFSCDVDHKGFSPVSWGGLKCYEIACRFPITMQFLLNEVTEKQQNVM